MIWISSTDEPDAIVVTVVGQLKGDYVEAVETYIQKAMGEQKPIHLFLRDVSHIDEYGRTLLSRLAEKGVELRASGLYTSHIVAEIRRESAMRVRVRPGAISKNGALPEEATELRPPLQRKPKQL